MSRAKFRAWDNQFNHWVGSAEYVIDPYSGKFLAVAGYEILKNEYDVTVEQNTGLKDKNGVDIYVGDIVVPYRSKDIAEHQVVVFDRGGFCQSSKISGNSFLGMAMYDFLVIGNIHENSGLLENEK